MRSWAVRVDIAAERSTDRPPGTAGRPLLGRARQEAWVRSGARESGVALVSNLGAWQPVRPHRRVPVRVGTVRAFPDEPLEGPDQHSGVVAATHVLLRTAAHRPPAGARGSHAGLPRARRDHRVSRRGLGRRRTPRRRRRTPDRATALATSTRLTAATAPGSSSSAQRSSSPSRRGGTSRPAWAVSSAPIITGAWAASTGPAVPAARSGLARAAATPDDARPPVG